MLNMKRFPGGSYGKELHGSTVLTQLLAYTVNLRLKRL